MSEKMDIGFLIPTIANELKKKANLVLKDYGITVKQGRFLGFLHENKGIETSQKDLQEHFEISHPTTVGIIKRLEQKNLITTRFDEINRRNKIVELAPAEKKINKRK
jgi:MarR family transcriptional repressor of mepA